MWLILNGKATQTPGLREAVTQARGLGGSLEVRVTWEAADMPRYVAEACDAGAEVIIAGGGDGTVNQVVNGLLALDASPRVAVAVLPLGTANDFAKSCSIPLDFNEALQLAASGRPVAIDVARANDHYFVNVASGGFGARVTANTPLEWKRLFGATAYALTGLVEMLRAPRLRPMTIRMAPDYLIETPIFIGAVGNGRQAGGGFQVTPRALLDDGLLDVLLVHDLTLTDVPALLTELNNPDADGNRFTRYWQMPWLEVIDPEDGFNSVNLDGEPMAGRPKFIRFELLHRCLPFILPAAAAPLLQQPIL